MKHPSDEEVVVQDNVVTSQGPGTALQFALTLGERLYGKEMADKVAKGLLVSLS
jgi:4-methyl-5(b-hydroxyethyl)-thiazole monophosphate biosynthesis